MNTRPAPPSPAPALPSAANPAAHAQDQFVGVVMIVLTLAGWTSIPLFLRHFAAMVDAWTSNGWRYAFAALAWTPVIVLGWRRKTLPTGLWRKALLPSAFNAVAQVFFTTAFYYLDPALAAFGLRSNIVFAALGAAILFAPERRVLASPWFLGAMVLVVGGTCGTLLLDEGFGGKDGADASHVALGVTFAVIAGALYAAYALAVRVCMKGIPTLVSFSAISLYTAAAMLALMLAFGDRMGTTALDLSGVQFLLLILSALVGIAMGHVTYYISIARLGVTVSAGVIQLQPFTVAVVSAPLFGEYLSPAQWGLGCVAVAGTIAMLAIQHRLTKAWAAADAAPGSSPPRDTLHPDPNAEFEPDPVVAASQAEHDAVTKS